MDNSILKKALGLEGAVVAGWEERPDGSVVVEARPRAAATRCPVCGGRCGAYDTLAPRLWRAPDLGLSKACVRYAPARVECPEHGAPAERAPWARRAESGMASSFGDRLAWGAAQTGEKAASGLWRVSRRTVGSACGRVYGELPERSVLMFTRNWSEWSPVFEHRDH